MSAEAIRIDGLVKRYESGGFCLQLDEFVADVGMSTAVLGHSGSGKTTLLDLVSGVQLPDAGRVLIRETTNLAELSEPARREWRRKNVGWVFQELELIDYLDGLQNVLLPTRLGTESPKKYKPRALELLERTGTAHLAHRKPRAMSQGERQRIAICRALLLSPAFLLCDEPTGNLDRDTADKVIALILECARDSGATLFFVTHDAQLSKEFDRALQL